ncbi:hypothetical protein ACOME3_004889 [Neoechinorhynchus agilis]
MKVLKDDEENEHKSPRSKNIRKRSAGTVDVKDRDGWGSSIDELERLKDDQENEHSQWPRASTIILF